jgi:hypothetical protein
LFVKDQKRGKNMEKGKLKSYGKSKFHINSNERCWNYNKVEHFKRHCKEEKKNEKKKRK